MCGEQDSPWCGAAWSGEHPSEPEQGGEAWEECVSSQASDKAEDEGTHCVIVIWKIINNNLWESRKYLSVINYIQVSEPKMSEVEEEISPFLSNLSLSRQAVSLVDPFRDDPTAEDDIYPDIEFSDTSEEGFIIKDI